MAGTFRIFLIFRQIITYNVFSGTFLKWCFSGKYWRTVTFSGKFWIFEIFRQLFLGSLCLWHNSFHFFWHHTMPYTINLQLDSATIRGRKKCHVRLWISHSMLMITSWNFWCSVALNFEKSNDKTILWYHKNIVSDKQKYSILHKSQLNPLWYPPR